MHQICCDSLASLARRDYILLNKIFCYFCILITITSVQVEELRFLKIQNFRDILRYFKILEIFREFLEILRAFFKNFSKDI